MKRFLLKLRSFAVIVMIVNLFLFSTTDSFAATKTWNGGAGTNLNWTTAGNWSPSGAPAAGDDVVFNTAGTLTFTTGPAASIAFNSLTISQGTVTLVAGASRTLTLGGNAGADFTVALGASFIMGTNISITLATNATAGINGTFTINTGRTYNTNGTTVVTTVTGTMTNAGTVTSSTATKLLFQSGAVFNFNQLGGTIPTANWDANSTCNITLASVSSGTGDWPSGTTQSFGHFSISTSGTGTNGWVINSAISCAGNFTINNGSSRPALLTNSATSRAITVSGDFNLASGTLDLSSSTGNGTLNVAGDFTNSGTLTETGTSTLSGIIFNGSGNQIFTSGGLISNAVNLTINNAAGVALSSSVTLSGALTLTSGILTVASGNTLTIANGNVIGGAPFSSTKHIATQVDAGTGAKGFLRVNNMANATPYLFPAGDGTNYLPVTLTPGSATIANNTYSVCSFAGLTSDGEPNGASFSTPQKNNCVDAVWRVNYNGAGAPTAPATNMTVAWPSTLEGVNFSGYSNVVIGLAHFDGPNWGQVVGIGDNTANTATRTGITTFSPFAVGRIDPTGGILAIKLTYFNAAKGNGYNTLNWQANCSSSQATFELLRSTDGINFTSINSIVANQARCAQPFNYNDNSAPSGTVYYRLKMIDVDGKVTYSAIVKLSSQAKDIELSGVAPNPVVNIAQVKVNTTKKDVVDLAVISADGKVVYHSSVQLQPGSSVVNLDITNLPTGVYMIKGLFSDGQTNTVKFIKQ